MLVLRHFVISSLCLLLFAPSGPTQAKVTAAEARKIAKEAYIFNFPMVMSVGSV